MRPIATALFASCLFAACAEPEPPGPERGHTLYATCAPCHGESGEGNFEFGAPSIAGLDAWYVETQLEHFRSGARGSHPSDVAGLRMRPMSQALRSTSDVRSVAAYVESLPTHAPESQLSGGNAERGRELFTACAECHGANGAGNRERNAPRLSHASDWYLFAQLAKFKDGIRGADPRDATGATMRPMATTLADQQAMRDVVAYIATLSRSQAR